MEGSLRAAGCRFGLAPLPTVPVGRAIGMGDTLTVDAGSVGSPGAGTVPSEFQAQELTGVGNVL